IRDFHVTGVQTCALPIFAGVQARRRHRPDGLLAGFFLAGFELYRVLGVGLDGPQPVARLWPVDLLGVEPGLDGYRLVVPEPARRSEERRVGKARRGRGAS